MTEQAGMDKTGGGSPKPSKLKKYRHLLRMQYNGAFWATLHLLKIARPYSIMMCRLNLYGKFSDGRCRWCGEKHGR